MWGGFLYMGVRYGAVRVLFRFFESFDKGRVRNMLGKILHGKTIVTQLSKQLLLFKLRVVSFEQTQKFETQAICHLIACSHQHMENVLFRQDSAFAQFFPEREKAREGWIEKVAIFSNSLSDSSPCLLWTVGKIASSDFNPSCSISCRFPVGLLPWIKMF